MARVTGIGGFFFRAEDTAGLAQWYEDNLGISRVPQDYDTDPWNQDAGPTVFSPFEKDTEYFGDKGKQWMLNLRVDDLDGMVSTLKSRGVAVTVDAENYPNGRFARLYDPEGNPVELWQPA